MGRWTPLILMAGGLAILLGTLLGINFPMDGRNAEVPTRRRESQVLPANINVNSTATGSSGESSVAQNSNNNQKTVQSAPTTTAQGSTTESTTPSTSVGQRRSTSDNNAPIRALW
ncbi:MAG: hypothetical protein HC836_10285 [Richelia sp. RM2_1_2]|nr:hypothetical protein [Rivularia sp. T60_A2020_040]NJL78651.1 hypothetical protein [Richelia sp. SM2_1_7]NJM21166.1 hypothetical protein [Richelia sp. SM1_7_0]NJN08039.1 hypothetical protein [Richelia sp. RM1_1_1]NJO27800.1 hypothetical protein [Richelia sp. SL_2_1]NJO58712.1 hypothetical protein [Richelia sp. RM2_1_2]